MILPVACVFFSFFFFNDTATPQIYTYLHTLSLHDALPIFWKSGCRSCGIAPEGGNCVGKRDEGRAWRAVGHLAENRGRVALPDPDAGLREGAGRRRSGIGDWGYRPVK